MGTNVPICIIWTIGFERKVLFSSLVGPYLKFAFIYCNPINRTYSCRMEHLCLLSFALYPLKYGNVLPSNNACFILIVIYDSNAREH